MGTGKGQGPWGSPRSTTWARAQGRGHAEALVQQRGQGPGLGEALVQRHGLVPGLGEALVQQCLAPVLLLISTQGWSCLGVCASINVKRTIARFPGP